MQQSGNIIRCYCGSTDFTPLGIQKTMIPLTKTRFGEDIYMINCTRCGTTLACPEAFYNKLILMGSKKSTGFEHKIYDLSER
jgi:hypothetical protein